MRPASHGAAALLRAGALVAFGTETVYGLGADATNDRAVAGIFAAKQRPRFNPLICHYPHADAAFADVVANAQARSLAAAFWPGPLTSGAAAPARLCREPAGQRGARYAGGARSCARHSARAAARNRPAGRRAIGEPLRQSESDHARSTCLDELSGRIAAVLDSGPCPVGVESTVLDLSGCRSRAVAARRRDGRGDRSGHRTSCDHGDAHARCAAIAGPARVALCAEVAGAAGRGRCAT